MSVLHLFDPEFPKPYQLRKYNFWLRLILRSLLEVCAAIVFLFRFTLWVSALALTVVLTVRSGFIGLMAGWLVPFFWISILGLRDVHKSIKTLARRLTLQEAQELLNKDKRAPILYLRSFRDRFAGDSPQVNIESDESLLYPVLREIGPVITIGYPDDPLPPLGAARHYVETKSDWHDVIKSYLSKARFVVISPDTTRGLLWELKTVFDAYPQEKIIVSLIGFHPDYVPYSKTADVFNEFRLFLYEGLDKKVPEDARNALFIHFGRDGVPNIIELEHRQRMPEVAVRFVLHKLLAEKGVRVNEQMPLAWQISSVYETTMMVTCLALFIIGIVSMVVLIIIFAMFKESGK